ncbi:MAG TPA: DUF448 domain-containing protein [Afifellaceae bacterium]|nr:DUF448 domain-containing protein [Afifellaceae bacterium]
MRNPRNERLGDDNAPAGPERRCILSGQHGARDTLIRLAVSPEGEVLPDALARAPGRGAWIGVDRATLESSIAKGKLKGALARAFKDASLTIPADLGARLEAALVRAVTERLGLELRAGRLLLGTERIDKAARSGRVAWLAHAADAGEDGCRRLDQAWRVGREAEGSGLAGTVLPLDRAALSVALGRDNVVHLALTDSAAADRLAIPLGRLMCFLGRERGSGNRPAPKAIHETALAVPFDDTIEDEDLTVR